jgi:hypothetical protein
LFNDIVQAQIKTVKYKYAVPINKADIKPLLVLIIYTVGMAYIPFATSVAL